MSLEKPSSLTTDDAHPYLDKEGGKIRGLFDGIAPKYDLLNHLLSFNLDRRWRKIAVRELAPTPEGRYLDACTGTGDLSFSLLKELRTRRGSPVHHAHRQVFSSDFSLPMLQVGQTKARDAQRPHFLQGDTLRLPFADGVFDGAMVGFGIRNVSDLDAGLRELRRVLRKEAPLVLLEFTAINLPIIGALFRFYSDKILPRIGNLLSRSPDDAYTYLHESIERWPDGDELEEIVGNAGFENTRWKRLWPGNVAVHVGYA